MKKENNTVWKFICLLHPDGMKSTKSKYLTKAATKYTTYICYECSFDERYNKEHTQKYWKLIAGNIIWEDTSELKEEAGIIEVTDDAWNHMWLI